jgi:hypothetical protein
MSHQKGGYMEGSSGRISMFQIKSLRTIVGPFLLPTLTSSYQQMQAILRHILTSLPTARPKPPPECQLWCLLASPYTHPGSLCLHRKAKGGLVKHSLFFSKTSRGLKVLFPNNSIWSHPPLHTAHLPHLASICPHTVHLHLVFSYL